MVVICFILFIILILIIVLLCINFNPFLKRLYPKFTESELEPAASEPFEKIEHPKKSNGRFWVKPFFKRVGGGTTNISNYKYYYTISGEFNGLKFDALRDILKEYNFHHKPVTEKVHASFGTFHTSNQSSKAANYDPLFFKQHAAIKNVLDGHHTICDKTILFKTIKNLIPIGYKYIPITYTVDEFEQLLDKDGQVNSRTPHILKKKDAARQMGVLVITSKEEYLTAKKTLKIHSKNAIISKYITNPLTVNGKKMHIRVYILLSIQSGITRCYVFDEYRIYIAGAKYEEKDWLNPNIHISGADSTKQRYNWPSDVDWGAGSPSKKLLFELHECLRILCLGMALSNIKTYEESDAGYHMYGADILLTKDDKAYILEVNKRPGFGWVSADPEDGFSYNFSKKYFMFILNSTIFPILGIKRQPEPLAEIIENGPLMAFAKLLTGRHRNLLIPIEDATKEELYSANYKIHFHNQALSYQHISDIEANEKLIYLISNNNTTIIGYLIILNRWINVAVIREFQFRGIASAIIAQFMEIYAAMHFINADNNPIIYMRDSYKNQITNFTQVIAKKLHFTSNAKYYERQCKIKNNITVSLNNFKLLTYNSDMIYTENGTNKTELIAQLNKYMINIHLPFIHLAYGIANSKTFLQNTLSTGSRFNEIFINQGAELKAALYFPSKLINSEYLLYKYTYEHAKTQYYELFYKYVSIEELPRHPQLPHYTQLQAAHQAHQAHQAAHQAHQAHQSHNSTYIVYDTSERLNYYMSLKELPNKIDHITNQQKKELDKLKELGNITIEEENTNAQFLIKKYYPPYLLDGKLMSLKLFIILYISENGIKKCFVFNQYIICTALEKFSVKNEKDWNNEHITQCRMIDTNKIYKWPDDIVPINDAILNPYIEKLSEMLVQSEYMAYPESNSGFTEFTIDLHFIDLGAAATAATKYAPVIGALNNTIQLWPFKDISIDKYNSFADSFSKDYYYWITQYVIFPHFGILPQIKPNAIHLQNIHLQNKVIHLELLIDIALEFNTERDRIQIYYIKQKIGHIELSIKDIKNSIITLKHIEIESQFRKKNIATHCIFILMGILGAYYAPNNIKLSFAAIENMEKLAHKLEFNKTGLLYSRYCR